MIKFKLFIPSLVGVMIMLFSYYMESTLESNFESDKYLASKISTLLEQQKIEKKNLRKLLEEQIEREKIEDQLKEEKEKEEKKNKSENNGKKKVEFSFSSLKKILSLAIPEMGLLITASISTVLATVSGLAIAGISTSILDAITIKLSYSILKKSIFYVFIIGTFASFFSFMSSFLFAIVGQRIVARLNIYLFFMIFFFGKLNKRLRKNLFTSITMQEIAFFDKNKTGELTSRLSSDTQVIQGTTSNFINLFIQIVQALSSFAIMFLLSWKLTLMMLSLLPVFVIIGVTYSNYIKRLAKIYRDFIAEANNVSEETISSIRTVRSFSQERSSQTKFHEKINDGYLIGRKMSFSS